MDKEHWEMTSRAMRGLRKDENEFIEVYLKRASDRNLSLITTRTVIETALYSSRFKDSSNKLSLSDLEELLALSDLLVLCANHRVALVNRFIEPDIKFHPTREFTLDLSFYKNIVHQYLTSTMAEEVKASVDSYETYYREKQKSTGDHDSFDRFNEMFSSEFGFSVESLFEFSAKLQDHYMKEKKLYSIISYNEIVSVFSGNELVTQKILDSILFQFSLYPRKAWNKDLPENCPESAIFPWRFMRRFSVLARPVIRLTKTVDGKYFIAPAMIKDCFSYFVNNLDNVAYATESFRTETAKKYWGKVVDKKGRKFTLQVKEIFDSKGFVTEPEVDMDVFSPPKENRGWGDIDVIAHNDENKKIFLVECKHLQRDMSLEDIVERLKEYKGDSKDPLGKHIRRTDWLFNNKNKLFEYLEIDDEVEYIVERLL